MRSLWDRMPFQSCSSWYLDVKSYCSRIFKLFDVIIDDVLILSDLVGFLCIFAFFFCNFTFHSTLGIVTKKLCNKNMIFKQSMTMKIRPFYNIHNSLNDVRSFFWGHALIQRKNCLVVYFSNVIKQIFCKIHYDLAMDSGL